MKNIARKIENMSGKTNVRYDINSDDLFELVKISGGDTCGLVCNSFLIGYMQGEKAAKAAIKKAEVA